MLMFWDYQNGIQDKLRESMVRMVVKTSMKK